MLFCDIEFWKYLIHKPFSIKKFFCRLKGHEGVLWYNLNGLEPDMHCKNCGDDLG
jgi:hypothetical protein